MTEALYNPEIEEALIGAVLINPSGFMVARTVVQADDFFLLRHTYIWQALTRLHNRKDAIDNITVAQELGAMDKLTEIGGQAYLTQLINNTPTSVHLNVYAQMVQRAALRRRLMKMADEIKLLAADEILETEKVLEQVSTKYHNVVNGFNQTTPIVWSDEALNYANSFADAWEGKADDITGYSTGIKSLDGFIRLKQQELTLIMGRTSVGKSAMLLSLWLNVMQCGIQAALWTGEMTVQGYVARSMAIESGVPTDIHFNKERLSTVQQNALLEAYQPVSEMQAWVDDTTAISMEKLHGKVMEWAHKGAKMIFIDHVGKIGDDGRFKDLRTKNRFIASQLADWARTHNVNIVAAIQSSRAPDYRPAGKRQPRLSDLEESSAWDHNADRIIGLYRPAIYSDEDIQQKHYAEAHIIKNRNGRVGVADLYYDVETTQYLNGTRKSPSHFDSLPYGKNGV